MAYVYRFRDKRTEEIIYVGKTKRPLEDRMDEHFGGKGHLSRDCYKSVGKVEYITVRTEADALFIENYLINKYKPLYNVKDKVQSTLTYKLDIKERWELFCVMNRYDSPFKLSNIPFKLSNIIDWLFWGGFIYFLILGIIGIYF